MGAPNPSGQSRHSMADSAAGAFRYDCEFKPGTALAKAGRMQTIVRNTLAAFSFFVIAACGGTSRSIGDVAIGSRSVHVTLESSFGDGIVSKYAIKPNAGSEKPGSLQCWWGSENDSSDKVTASYDAKDLDFDCLVLTKSPSTGKLFIELTYAGNSTRGSIAVAN